jgi:UDP-N-acetylglucosamine 2-epimerase
VSRAVRDALARTQPHAVLVHGDTTTCLASAIAAFHEGIRVGHVEAGLRTYDFEAPWPEEMNRRLTDPICRWCFAPTRRAGANLLSERIPQENIFVTGNTAVDALHFVLKRVRAKPFRNPGVPEEKLIGRRLILVTGHRRESFGEAFRNQCFALREIADTRDDIVIVYPVHLNPNVQRPVQEILRDHDRICLIPPLEYVPFVALMDRCTLIITDSGGIQEEAPSLGKPVLVMRRATERPEAEDLGLARIVGNDRNEIVKATLELLSDAAAYARMVGNSNPYGDGRAAERIADILQKEI